jgi:hypothetical protein
MKYFRVGLLLVCSICCVWGQNFNVTSGSLQLDNGYGVYGKNSGGVSRQILSLYSDNNLYFTVQDGAQIFRTGSTASERLRITPTGEIGLGISSPQSQFHLRTVSTYTGVVWPVTFNNPFNGGYIGYGVGLKLQNSSAESGGNEQYKWAGIAAVASTGWSNITDLVFYTNDHNYSTNVTLPPVERMRIQRGNLGIGTAAPVSALHVVTGSTDFARGVTSAQYSSDGYAAQINFFKSRGSEAQPVPVQAGDVLGNLAYRGYDGVSRYTSGSLSIGGQIRVLATEAWTDGAHGSCMVFETASSGTTSAVERLKIDSAGNVGIGTSLPTHKLSVNGSIRAKEVIVETTGWSDYVLADDYKLAPLMEVERHIKQNRTLSGIPSAAQVAQEGVGVGEMQAKLLAKVEELTLYVIELKKENDQLKRRMDQLGATVTAH